MAQLLDVPLEDLIKKNPTNTRGRGRGARGGASTRGGSRRPVNVARRSVTSRGRRGDRSNADGDWKHDCFQGERNNGAGDSSGRVSITNLHYNATQEDLEPIFRDIGPVKSLHIKYDRSGRSLGKGEVVYIRSRDAAQAVRRLSGVNIDNQPMELSLVVGRGGSDRPPRRRFNNNNNNNSNDNDDDNNDNEDSFNRRPNNRSGVKSSRGRSSRGGRGGRRGGARPKPTAEELDKQLDDYRGNNSADGMNVD